MQTETELTAAWLAEHIMGWHRHTDDFFPPEYDGPLPVFCDREGKALVMFSNLPWEFNPFVKIQDAWQIVEAIRARPVPQSGLYRPEVVECAPQFADYTCYRARFVRVGDELWQHAQTAPEAICHAAYDWWRGYGQEQAG